MKAMTVIGEYALADSAHVTVVPPCNTGDALIDSHEVDQGLTDMFSSTMTDGVERGGWLMQRPDGSYYIQPFPSDWAANACGIDAPLGTMPPSGAVSWVHTHPWANGDPMTGCPGIVIGGRTFPITYRNESSTDDDKAAGVWGPGWIIDKNLIFKFDSGGNKLEQYQRCGY
jgi:hypothetical protein